MGKKDITLTQEEGIAILQYLNSKPHGETRNLFDCINDKLIATLQSEDKDVPRGTSTEEND